MQIEAFPSKPRPAILMFFRAFFTLKTCLQSLLLENLTITRSPFKRWESLTMLQFWFSNILQTEFCSWFWWTDEDIPTIFTHSLHEYWALAQHRLSIWKVFLTKQWYTPFYIRTSKIGPSPCVLDIFMIFRVYCS